MEFLTIGRRRPLSRFMFEVAVIWMASTVLLCQKPAALLWTLVPSQLIQWLVFWTWTALPFLGSPLLTACLCSLSLTFSVLLVSPTYIPLSTSYGNLVHHSCLLLFWDPCLHLHQFVFQVLIGLKAGFTLSEAQTF